MPRATLALFTLLAALGLSAPASGATNGVYGAPQSLRQVGAPAGAGGPGAIARNAYGTSVSAWAEGGAHPEIWAATDFERASTLQRRRIAAVEPPARIASAPIVATDTSGITIAWTQTTDGTPGTTLWAATRPLGTGEFTTFQVAGTEFGPSDVHFATPTTLVWLASRPGGETTVRATQLSRTSDETSSRDLSEDGASHLVVDGTTSASWSDPHGAVAWLRSPGTGPVTVEAVGLPTATGLGAPAVLGSAAAISDLHVAGTSSGQWLAVAWREGADAAARHRFRLRAGGEGSDYVLAYPGPGELDGAGAPDLDAFALDAFGGLTAAWSGDGAVHLAYAGSPGDAFAAPVSFPLAHGAAAGSVVLVPDGDGDQFAAWTDGQPGAWTVRAAFRRGSGFHTGAPAVPYALVSGFGPAAGDAGLALSSDRDGNGTIGWSEGDVTRAAVIDRAPPQLGYGFSGGGIDAPSYALVGRPLQLSVSPHDDWSEPVAVHWEFDDGTPGADGAAVTHAFADFAGDPGATATRLPTAVATDAAGNATAPVQTGISVSRVVPPFVAPVTRPEPLRLALSRTRFRPATGRGAEVDTKDLAKRGTRAALLTVVAPSAGHATFSLAQLVPGRSSGAKCKKSGRKGKRCTIVKAFPHTIGFDFYARPYALRLTGRWAGRALAPGRYRLTGVIRGGNLDSAPASITFRIGR